MKLLSVLKLIRPHQWLKNLFIFLPLFFHGKFFDFNLLSHCIGSFFGFSLIASSIYCFNDIFDVEADRKHPKKSKRPIASGSISITQGYLVMICLLIASVLVLLLFLPDNTKYKLLAIFSFYFFMNVAYCIKLKHFVIIDVMIISIGFVIRVVIGGVATSIALSEWIIIMTFLLALFLAFAKRRDDVVLFEKTGIAARKKTNRYNLDFMNQILSIIASITMMAYIMYTISPEVTARFDSDYIFLTSFFVLAGIIRYLQLSLVDLRSGNPTNILVKDLFIQLCIIGWGLSFMLIIYTKI